MDDYYMWDGVDSPQAQVDGHKKFYEESIYPLLHDHQRVFIVPGSFATHDSRPPQPPLYPKGNETYCFNGTFEGCDEYMGHQANAYFTWAESDPRVAGIAPWHWDSRNIGVVTPYKEVGVADMPKTRAAWKAIGQRIRAQA